MPFFENFLPYVKENYLKNYDKLLEFAEKKRDEFKGEIQRFSTRYYNMSIKVDYNKIIKRLNETKEIAETL